MAVEVVEASRVHEAEILGPVHFGATRSERSRADLIDRFTRLDAEAEQRQRVCVRASAIGSFENSANLSRLSSMMKACSPTSMQAAESSLKAGLKLTRSFAKNAMLRRTSTTGRFTNRVRPGCDQGAQVHSREDLRSKVHDDVVDQDQKRTAAIIRSWRTRDVATHPSPGKSSARSCSLEPSVSMVNAGARHVVSLSLMGVNRAMPHWQIEQDLRASGIPWTFLRPAFFSQNLGGAYRYDIRTHDRIRLASGRGRTSFIDARDIADTGGSCVRPVCPAITSARLATSCQHRRHPRAGRSMMTA